MLLHEQGKWLQKVNEIFAVVGTPHDSVPRNAESDQDMQNRYGMGKPAVTRTGCPGSYESRSWPVLLSAVQIDQDHVDGSTWFFAMELETAFNQYAQYFFLCDVGPFFLEGQDGASQQAILRPCGSAGGSFSRTSQSIYSLAYPHEVRIPPEYVVDLRTGVFGSGKQVSLLHEFDRILCNQYAIPAVCN